MRKVPVLAIAVLYVSVFCAAQTSPNLLNGAPPRGSYDGGVADAINLMNGNLTVHIPLPVSTPQRGKLAIKYYLVVNAKTWQATGDPNTLTGQWNPTSVCTIVDNPSSGPCGQGPLFVSTASFGIIRNYGEVFTEGVGTDYSVSDPTSFVTWDGSSHSLQGGDGSGAGTFVATDTSGYRVVISGSNGLGLPYNAVIIDRDGTQYSGSFIHDQGTCVSTTSFGYPTQDGSTKTTTCAEYFIVSTVTDANGNVLNAPVGIPTLLVPKANGPTISTHEAVGTEVNGCLTSFGTPWVGYLQYPAPNGQTNQIKLCFAIYPQLATSFSPAGIHQFQDNYSNHPFPGNYRQPIYLSNVILPDNTQWSISYDSYGEITNVGTPTGASIVYSWAEGQFPISSSTDLTTVSRAVHTRSVHDVNGNVFNWTYQWGAQASDGTMSHTVADSNSNDTVHVFAPVEAIPTVYPYNFKEIRTIAYQGTGAARTPLQQVDTTWLVQRDGGLGVPTDTKTTLFPSQNAKLVHRDYDPTSPPLGVVVSEKDYDWGAQGSPGALLREQDTVYQWQKDSRYLSANMLDLPASTITVSPVAASNTKASCPADAAGTLKPCMAETDYTYDEPAYLTSYENTVGTLPVGSHVAAPNPVRGNLSTVSKWLSNGGSVVGHTNWYDTGDPYLQIDPLGHTTTISYDLAYNGTLPTMTCNAKGQCISATYDVNTGLLSSFTDPNAAYPASGTTQGDPAHTSTYNYDFMARMISAVSPADSSGQHPQTTFNYPTPTTVQRLQSITSSLTDTLTTHDDGLGHIARTEHLTPDGTVLVDTSYDGLGHVTSVTNPYITPTDATYGVVQTIYDALGRPTTITEQDQSVKTADYSAGNCVTSFDETGKQRKSCSDGLGRLVEVDEPNPGASATYATGNVVINGAEQANPQSASSGTATVTIGGAEYSEVIDPCQDQEPPRSCPRTVWDIGQVTITVNGVQKSANYSQFSNASTVAAALMSAFHNDATAPVDASCSDSSCSNPVITLTARTTGAATNYSLSASPLQGTAPDFWATPSGSTLTGGRDATSTPDTGSVTINVNGTAYTTTYGGSDTGALIASRLAGLISGGTVANATASGSTVNIGAKAIGPVGNSYSLSASYIWDSGHFAQPSFTTSSSGSSLSGGYNAGDVGNSPYVTLYQYDALGNLLRVDQKGSAPLDTTQWRTRTFTYDSLSRLLTAQNPESGTSTYSYDADGDLLMKTSPAPNQTGSATQVVSYCYDELNQTIKKDYQVHTFAPPACPITAPVETYTYDVGANGIGHLTGVTDQAGSGSYTYDPLGRTKIETRIISGVSKTISYDYNLDGSLFALHYPSGRTVTYAPDFAGRVTSVTDSNGTPYASSLAYWPNGSEYQWHLPSIYLRTDLNARLQVSGFYSDNGQTASFFMNKTYSYGAAHQDNGNVMSIINNKDASRTQTYTYDSLNRITSGYSAATSGALSWGENYAIDPWGNLMISPMSGKAHGGNFQHAGDANNHASGLGYDAAGNLTNYTAPNQYLYDPENRIQSTAGTNYTYDADGNRVEKVNGATGSLYWYGKPGILAESDLNGNVKSEYVFVNGKRAARIDSADNSVHYYLSDHLNSTSMIISAGGVVEDESDYSAFGTEYPVTSSGGNHYKFTGKERDAESGLDYFGARYYSSLTGRFITPDWAEKATAVPYAEFSDPQSLNLYSYVRNVPTTRYDPDGHFDDPFGVFADGDTRFSNIASPEDLRFDVTVTTTITTTTVKYADGRQESFTSSTSEITDVSLSTGSQQQNSSNQSGAASTKEAQNEQHQYELVVAKTNKLLAGATDQNGNVLDARDHLSSNCNLVGGNCEFKISHDPTNPTDSAFSNALNKALGEAQGDAGAHGGLTPPTHRVGFYISLHHDNDAVHIDHFNGAKFPVGTLFHAIVDVGVGSAFYGTHRAFAY